MSFLKKFLSFFTRGKAPKFGEIAIRRGFVSEKDVKEALKAQKEYEAIHKIHKEIGAILAEKGILTSDDVKLILEVQKKETSLMAWFYAFTRLSH